MVEINGPLTVGEQYLGIRTTLKDAGLAFAFEDQIISRQALFLR